MIYLDYQATTPMAQEAFAAMEPWLTKNFANPHSAHKAGRAAAAVVEAARTKIADMMPAGGRVIFTSGATEAINLAIRGAVAAGAVTHLAHSGAEHAAIIDSADAAVSGSLESGNAVSQIGVSADGLIDISQLPARPGLACVMQVNNEIGTIQPVDDIAQDVHERGGILLCDAVQSFGRMPLPSHADMITISAHKIHGPKGIGALWISDGIDIAAVQHGGGQEMGLRSGTLSPALCAGFGAAAELAARRMEADHAHAGQLWARALELFDGWTVNGSTQTRYKGNLNIRKDGLDAARLISECRDIMFSAGSACASGSGRPSHVLSAIGLSDKQAKNSIRLGWGRYSTLAELEEAASQINAGAKRQL